MMSMNALRSRASAIALRTSTLLKGGFSRLTIRFVLTLIGPINVSTNLIVNRENPPFNNVEVRKAMALALDRKAFIDIIYQGAGDVRSEERRVGRGGRERSVRE